MLFCWCSLSRYLDASNECYVLSLLIPWVYNSVCYEHMREIFTILVWIVHLSLKGNLQCLTDKVHVNMNLVLLKMYLLKRIMIYICCNIQFASFLFVIMNYLNCTSLDSADGNCINPSCSSPSNYREKNIKRIAGLPGDWIDLPPFDTLRVPEGHCWVIGDNEACSLDSRSFGPVRLEIL